jgi:hypothetical protein
MCVENLGCGKDQLCAEKATATAVDPPSQATLWCCIVMPVQFRKFSHNFVKRRVYGPAQISGGNKWTATTKKQ